MSGRKNGIGIGGNNMAESPLLTLKQAAEYLQLSPKTLQNAVSNGVLQSIGRGRKRRFLLADLVEYLQSVGHPALEMEPLF